MSTLRQVADTASELGQQVMESAGDFSRTAGRKIADARENTGSALHAAASSVRQRSRAIDEAARGTARKLDAAGSFVEDFTSKNILASIRKFGRDHSTAFVIAGLALGFVAGAALSHSGRSRE
jgi:ElaB/YqjD/DUF883 family membrane-anchored ribosome-binding protein